MPLTELDAWVLSTGNGYLYVLCRSWGNHASQMQSQQTFKVQTPSLLFDSIAILQIFHRSVPLNGRPPLQANRCPKRRLGLEWWHMVALINQPWICGSASETIQINKAGTACSSPKRFCKVSNPPTVPRKNCGSHIYVYIVDLIYNI